MTGLETALIASLAGVAGAGAAGALSKKEKTPKVEPIGTDQMSLPEMPTQAKAPGSDRTQAEFDVQRARDDERRRAGKRQGQSNSILTGSLGVQAPAQTARKTLLGE